MKDRFKMKDIGSSSVNISPLTQNNMKIVLSLSWASFIVNKDLIVSQLRGPLNLSFIAEVEGHLAGFILARIAYLNIPMNEMCVVDALVVDPNYRNQGIGSLLLNHLESACCSKGIQKMRVHVDESNSALLNYFHRLGFNRSNMINLEHNCGV